MKRHDPTEGALRPHPHYLAWSLGHGELWLILERDTCRVFEALLFWCHSSAPQPSVAPTAHASIPGPSVYPTRPSVIGFTTFQPVWLLGSPKKICRHSPRAFWAVVSHKSRGCRLCSVAGLHLSCAFPLMLSLQGSPDQNPPRSTTRGGFLACGFREPSL